MNLKQKELYEWQNKNFKNEHLWKLSKGELIEMINRLQMALGMAEEVGEIAHHVLKGTQEIRGGVKGINAREVADGVADTLVFGTQLLSSLEIDAEYEIENTINTVLRRDWINDPNGDNANLQRGAWKDHPMAGISSHHDMKIITDPPKIDSSFYDEDPFAKYEINIINLIKSKAAVHNIPELKIDNLLISIETIADQTKSNADALMMILLDCMSGTVAPTADNIIHQFKVALSNSGINLEAVNG